MDSILGGVRYSLDSGIPLALDYPQARHVSIPVSWAGHDMLDYISIVVYASDGSVATVFGPELRAGSDGLGLRHVYICL
jgi:hypothetical protein